MNSKYRFFYGGSYPEKFIIDVATNTLWQFSGKDFYAGLHWVPATQKDLEEALTFSLQYPEKIPDEILKNLTWNYENRMIRKLDDVRPLID